MWTLQALETLRNPNIVKVELKNGVYIGTILVQVRNVKNDGVANFMWFFLLFIWASSPLWVGWMAFLPSLLTINALFRACWASLLHCMSSSVKRRSGWVHMGQRSYCVHEWELESFWPLFSIWKVLYLGICNSHSESLKSSSLYHYIWAL